MTTGTGEYFFTRRLPGCGRVPKAAPGRLYLVGLLYRHDGLAMRATLVILAMRSIKHSARIDVVGQFDAEALGFFEARIERQISLDGGLLEFLDRLIGKIVAPTRSATICEARPCRHAGA